jgi:ubiquinone/menaquinone biosynthesis C-methylase UbiE
MTTLSDCLSPSAANSRPTTLALDPLKTRLQSVWASGDFAVIGTTLQLVGESLCEAADVCTHQRVLDVACGNGNASLAAARRGCRVVGVDFVPELLQRASERAAAERADLELVVGDAEALPFAAGSFDVVLSTYGVMFAPNHEQAARELIRVCAPGGTIALANWTPDGFIGQLLRLVGKHVPPPAGVRSPALWGDEAHLHHLFGHAAAAMHIERKLFQFRYASAEHFVEVFRNFYGPTHKAFASLGAAEQDALSRDIVALLDAHDRGAGRSLVVPAEYVEVVIHTADA